MPVGPEAAVFFLSREDDVEANEKNIGLAAETQIKSAIPPLSCRRPDERIEKRAAAAWNLCLTKRRGKVREAVRWVDSHCARLDAET